MKLLTLVVSFISLGVIQADVSHLQRDHRRSGSGHTFVANNGQLVRQSFNANGDASYSSRTYNGAGNDINPVQHLRQNYFSSSASGCNGCMTRALNIKQNTQHNTQQNAYASNPFTRTSSSFNRISPATVSGSSSPREVNDFFQQQQSSSCSEPNTACVAPKFCFNGIIDQLDAHKAIRSSSGRCYAPEVCCRFAAQKRVAQYAQDNSVAAAESTSEVLTKEGYVVRRPANQYLPSLPEYKPQPSNDQQTYVRPSTYAPPRPSQPPRTQPPRIVPQPIRPIPQRPIQYQPQPTEIRQVQYNPAPIVVPVGCSAAMNCTNIQYCNAAGVISKTPVLLTPQQEMFRVPLTDCREPNTKEIGKCCRDPDYVDPWPVGRTGQYVPEELNNVFNSGAYKPEPSLNVPVKVKFEQEGYVLPQPSNKQQRLYLPPQNSNRI